MATLTQGCVIQLFHDAKPHTPTVQLIELKAASSADPNATKRVKVKISDGEHWGFGMLTSGIAQQVLTEALRQNAFVKLKSYMVNQIQNTKICIIVDLEIVGEQDGEQVGEPVPWQEAVSAPRTRMSADVPCPVRALLSRLPHYSQYSQARQEPLRPNDPVYAYLERGFVQRVTRHRGPKQGDPHREAPKLKVVRIEQIFSKRLQDKYLAAVQDEIGLCGSKLTSLETIDAIPVRSFEGTNMNEFLLYHGAPTGLIPRLVLQGLDPRNAGTHFGKLFGAGTYLASHSSKCDIYTKPNEHGERCALVVRACLGEPHTAKTQMREALRPPERPDKRGPLSSVMAATVGQGGCVEHPEFIVYKDSQTLPQFAIYYRHEEDCKCTHCWREVQHVNLKVVDEDGIEVNYKCNANRPLGKLMDAYCNRYSILGLSMDDVRFFMFDGVQIEEAQTPAQLGMKDGDIIDVIKRAKKRKSSSGTSSDTLSGTTPSGSMVVRTHDENGLEIPFALNSTTPLQKLMQAYCNRQGMDMKNLHFTLAGVQIYEEQTPADVGMVDGDVIDVEVVL